MSVLAVGDDELTHTKVMSLGDTGARRVRSVGDIGLVSLTHLTMLLRIFHF